VVYTPKEFGLEEDSLIANETRKIIGIRSLNYLSPWLYSNDMLVGSYR
jgi:hypothetical protein